MARLTKKGFREWLEQKRAARESVAPKNYGECNCPIANYLIDQGASVVGVAPADAALRVDGESVAFPAWAFVFAEDFDNTRNKPIEGKRPARWPERRHTAKRALEILDSL